jgi:hypothetical protein
LLRILVRPKHGELQIISLGFRAEKVWGGSPRGTPEDAQKAVDALNGTMLAGRKLTVNEARPQVERGGSRGGHHSAGRREFSRRY